MMMMRKEDDDENDETMRREPTLVLTKTTKVPMVTLGDIKTKIISFVKTKNTSFR